MLPWRRLLAGTHEHIVEYLVNNSIFRRIALKTHINLTKLTGECMWLAFLYSCPMFLPSCLEWGFAATLLHAFSWNDHAHFFLRQYSFLCFHLLCMSEDYC
ncbi:hypothetical protein BC829DRAFT_393333 [Chytridium lagenaria]|nr:hypothetical protein BC829DRAFT_393333 [Chytridium lagenaria]